MTRHVYGWFLGSAATVGLLATSSNLLAQVGTEPGRVNAAKENQPDADPNNPTAREPGQAAGQPGQTGRVVVQAGQANQTGAGQRGNLDQDAQQQIDAEIASCLILANQNEVALAKIAQEKSQNDEVKQFAKKLEEDHTQLITTLSKFTSQNYSNRDTTRNAAGEAGRDGRNQGRNENRNEGRNENRNANQNENRNEDRNEGRNEDRNEGRADQRNENAANRDANAPRVQSEVRVQNTAQNNQNAQQNNQGNRVGNNATGNHSQLQVIQHQIKHEVADQCLADARKELNSKESNKFDECFVGMQIACHMKMHSELTVFERHASGNLQTALSTAQQTTDKHLEELKGMMEKLAKDNNNSNDK